MTAAFDYVLRQDKHHGVASDPFQEGSCLLDLLGMRALGNAVAGRVREHLPRVRREHPLPHLGLASLEEAVAIDHLADATCAAFALADLSGNSAEVVEARAAAVHAARDAGTARSAEALALTPRAVQRMAHRAPSASDVRAVRLQMSVRMSLRMTLGTAPAMARGDRTRESLEL
ncbi:MAG: hypothetical protein Q8P18_32310 [Pseudomonadota bacterium]|nr:hypothetical protein [Pseudomonadota bacterium]